MSQIPTPPLSDATTSQKASTARPTAQRPPRPAPSSAVLPDWLIVVLVLGFIFVGLPALMPLFWAIYLLGH